MSLSGVVFDFDGVIADTEGLHLRAYQDTLTDTPMSLSREAYYERYLGYDDVGVFTTLARDQRQPLGGDEMTRLIAEKGRRFDTLVETAQTLFPGAADCIRRLAKETPLAIASGALHAEIERILNDAGLRTYFAAIVAADDVERSKPAPDAYREAVKRLTNGATPKWSSYVAIEDSQWGLEAARVAGLRSVAITNSYPATVLTGADLVVDHLAAVDRDVLEQLCE
jgi:beta-phosphoglucomutase